MALEVYVGPLARYYGGDWGSVAGNAGTGSRARDIDRVRAAVLAWRDGLGAALGNNTPVLLDWEEKPDSPSFTGRPGWDGFGSLVLWAAYAEHPLLRLPASLPEEWDNDPALVRCNAEGFRSRYSHLVRHVELWLPVPFAFSFEGEDIDRRRIVVGSSPTLVRQLAELNAATWKVGNAEAAAWGRRPPGDKAPLELQARHAFAVMSDLARKAIEHRLPMKLDF